MAFQATGVQAQTFEWFIEEEPLFELEGEESLTATGGEFKLEGELGTSKVTIVCQKQQASGKIEEGGLGSAKVEFSEECEVRGPKGEELPVCPVKEPIVADTKTRIGGDGEYVIFEPKEGGAFTEITIEDPFEVCIIAGTYPVNGTVAGEGEPEGEQVEQPLTFSPSISTAAGTTLTLGTKEAFLTGTSTQVLTGEQPWGLAKCKMVWEFGTGTHNDSECREGGGSKEWIWVHGPNVEFSPGVFCAKVKVVGTGKFKNSTCTQLGPPNEYILVTK